ncbi:spermidine synthase [Oleiphilus messinensis]|uniref:Spermidine synthase n=1 Tax=Oleiphilus messinensis TaxID=141451 RepID=A0A1Y0I221_9GAMM|nr:hypothetical protein [Oleiphilus messinensis]ARU54517.1 spermidine synthase [Oleiphilus messinensis]
MTIAGREIYRIYDPLGPIQVFDDGSRRVLAFGDNDEQSCLSLEHPYLLQHTYTRAMVLSLLFVEPSRILILGLGGGCLPAFLHHHLLNSHVQVVELRQAVIDVAYRFFALPRDSRLEVVQSDVRRFFKQTVTGPVDLIMSDLFLSGGIDRHQFDTGYLEQCYHRLSDQGWLVLNCWLEHRREQTSLRYLCELFPDVRVCSTESGNWIIFAGKQPCAEDKKTLEKRVRKLSSRFGWSLMPQFKQLQLYRERFSWSSILS